MLQALTKSDSDLEGKVKMVLRINILQDKANASFSERVHPKSVEVPYMCEPEQAMKCSQQPPHLFATYPGMFAVLLLCHLRSRSQQQTWFMGSLLGCCAAGS